MSNRSEKKAEMEKEARKRWEDSKSFLETRRGFVILSAIVILVLIGTFVPSAAGIWYYGTILVVLAIFQALRQKDHAGKNVTGDATDTPPQKEEVKEADRKDTAEECSQDGDSQGSSLG